jgi:hypothetical protein
MKISAFILGFVIVSLFAVCFAFLIGDFNDSYSGTVVNESQLDSYNKIDEMNELAGDMNESLQKIQQGSAVDVVGGLITSGFTVLKSTWTSFSMYTDITSGAIDNANLGQSAVSWKTTALIIGLLLFIFAMVGVLLGREV